MEELKELTDVQLYEEYRTQKLESMGVHQDPNAFKEINPVAKLEEERQQHDQKMVQMEAQMKAVFEQKVQEKRQKLQNSENEVHIIQIFY